MKNNLIDRTITESGEIIERPFTEDEVIYYNQLKQNRKDELQAEADKATAKTSAQAKLAALGLTEEEVASILG